MSNYLKTTLLVALILLGVVFMVKISDDKNTTTDEIRVRHIYDIGAVKLTCINGWVVVFPVYRTAIYLRDENFNPVKCESGVIRYHPESSD